MNILIKCHQKFNYWRKSKGSFFLLIQPVCAHLMSKLTFCHLPLKLASRMYLSRDFPSVDSICGQMPEWLGHKSLCMLCRAWAMAYTASITNCTFPSCSYLESIPIRSWPVGGKRRHLGECVEKLLNFTFYPLWQLLFLSSSSLTICCCLFNLDSQGMTAKENNVLEKIRRCI